MAYDFNGKYIIPKGTLVKVSTTNGGELFADLSHNHYPTYDAEVLVHGREVIIPAFRIKSVEALTYH